jgi:methionyl-tRNA formyltransferase
MVRRTRRRAVFAPVFALRPYPRARMSCYAAAATRRVAPASLGRIFLTRGSRSTSSSATRATALDAASSPRVASNLRGSIVARASGARPGAAAFASAAGARRRLVFLGTPEVAASALEALLDAAASPDAEFEVHAVVSQPGRPRGRGRSKSGPPPPSPVAEAAMARGVPEERILCPVKANDPAFLDALRDMAPDLMVTAAYGNFLPQKFLDIPKLGTLNIHPSLLPQFRGAAPVQRALERGVDVTGVSVAYTVLEMDAGPVLRRVERPLDGDEKHDQLLAELFQTGANALLEVLPRVWSGEVSATDGATPQSELGEISHAPKVSVDESVLDFVGSDARTLHNKVRGFAGWPGTKATFEIRKEGEEMWSEVTLKIVGTRVGTEGDETRVTFGKDHVRVPCGGGGWLEVTELQPPGKKVMRAGDYANGMRGCEMRTVASGA